MKWKNSIVVIASLTSGIMLSAWTELKFWYDIKEGLLVFFGFLAAALVQVMPVTANFLQSDALTPSEAVRLTRSLTKQQHYWIGLLTATLIAMMVVIAGVALRDAAADFKPIWVHAAFMEISWANFIVFLIGTSVSFVFFRMFGLFEGMLSLHSLRGELVISAAKRRADSIVNSQVLQPQSAAGKISLPAGYGEKIPPE